MTKRLLSDTLKYLRGDDSKRSKWNLEDEHHEGSSILPNNQLESARTISAVQTQIETGGKTFTAQYGSILNMPQFNRVRAERDLHVTLNVNNTYTQSPGGSDETKTKVDVSDVGETSESTGASSPQTEELIIPEPKKQHISYYQEMLQSNLQNKFMCAQEGWTEKKDEQLLDDIYTELYITAGGDVHINTQHEVRKIEAVVVKPPDTEKIVKPCDMFKPPSGRYRPIRTALTKGIAGIGKTFLVHKFVLDWAEGRTNQDVHLIFPFSFRQLNLWKGEKMCLAELIHKCTWETRGIKKEALNFIFKTLQSSGNTNYDKSNFKLLFVLDGLDESRLQLDCSANNSPEEDFDVTVAMSVDMLITNLINRNLLPAARLWITTRPAAAHQIHSDYVNIMTEIRGFTDPQKEVYFKKRFGNEKAIRIFSHIKASRSLHIMCHIPVFCWITATVLEEVMKTRKGGELPKTLTEMYAEFLKFQIHQTKEKYNQKKCVQYIESLAKLAFCQLEKGNLIFYEKDLKESGIDVSGASVYSGVFTQIFKEERGKKNDEDKMFSFVHLSVQEFLAALHVHLTFIKSGVNLLSGEQTTSWWKWFPFRKKSNPSDFYQTAVDKTIWDLNGTLDLFLRFLLGLSLETNQRVLQGLVAQIGSSSQSIQETIEYIKKKIGENQTPELSTNLFYCLNELNDRSLVEEVQRYLSSGGLSSDELSRAQWSALCFIIMSSEEDLDVFDLNKFFPSEQTFLRLFSVVKASNKAL